MPENTPIEPPRPASNPAVPIATRFFIVLIVATLAFLAGFTPGWFKSRSAARKFEKTHQELAISQIQNKLASAAIDARRAEYEPARQAASQFFTELRDELDRDSKSAFTPAQREEAKKLLSQRDDLITLLARGDPAAANKLTDLYVAYRKLTQN